jgi:predicted aspartyl protease
MQLAPWLAAGLPLLLFACAAPPPAPPAGTPAPQVTGPVCTPHKLAEVPVSMTNGFVNVVASIDDKSVSMLIDTGAETSVVTPYAVSALGLETDRSRSTRLMGTGGVNEIAYNALLSSMRLGTLEMPDQSVAVGPLPGPSNTSNFGIIGADWLTNYDVELDLGHNRLAIYEAGTCNGAQIPWNGPRTAVIGQLYGRLMILSITIDGHPVRALLDSGANFSTLNDTAATRIGVTSTEGDRTSFNVGIDGGRQAAHLHRFAEMKIGGETIRNPPIIIAPVRIPAADMLLGTEWLRRNRVWISYATHRVTFQPVGPLAPTSPQAPS